MLSAILGPAAIWGPATHPATISAFDSASGLPHSAVMMAAMSSVAAIISSYHLGTVGIQQNKT